jgi:hypothetical protein
MSFSLIVIPDPSAPSWEYRLDAQQVCHLPRLENLALRVISGIRSPSNSARSAESRTSPRNAASRRICSPSRRGSGSDSGFLDSLLTRPTALNWRIEPVSSADFLPNLGMVVTCTWTWGVRTEGIAHDKVHPPMRVGPMSTERLDGSQESFDLKEALFAGFAKSRFSSIAQRIEPHAVVRTIIFLVTLLYLGRLFGGIFLQKRLPNPTTEYVLCATIGPLSFWYVIHQNLDLLRTIWENPWGKLAYGLVASITVTFCKVMADQEIRLLTQSNPSLFPSAQQAITVFAIILMVLTEISIVMLTPLLWKYIKFMVQASLEISFLPFLSAFRLREMLGLARKPWTFRSFPSSLTRIAAPLWAVAFIFFIMPFFDNGFAEFGGKPFSPMEALLLWSSFIPNDLGLEGSDRVCINLPPDTLVSPFSTKDPIPSRVVIAQRITTDPDRLGRSYIYHVVTCSKPTDSSAFFESRPR